ncbi:MAG: tetraacyldisaccharide 4'-kinase [Rhodospirillales bacterium]|nr:tetraacyldisaccharide 4'-kinase [Rhodospirillales bacterium]
MEDGGKVGNALFPLLFSPASAIVSRLAARRAARPGFLAPVPVLCCGNVTLGGAGKTILALALARLLAEAGIAVHILARGYGGRLAGPLRVQTGSEPPAHDATAVGDEALVLAAAAPTWIGADRAATARAALAAGAKAFLLDDGLQNPTLEKSLSFLVIDGAAGFGNGRVVPAGPLREPPSAAARRVQAAVLIGADLHGARALLPPALPVLTARLLPGPEAALLAGRPVLAFAGIARPAKFFKTLEEAGAVLLARRSFPDHHPYRPREVARLLAEAARLGALPVTTAKDRVRLPPADQARVAALSVSLAFDDPPALEALLSPLFPLMAGP